MIDVTARLGAFGAGLQFADIPADVRERCRMSLLDGIGIMLGAADFAQADDDRFLRSYLAATAPPGVATVLGHGIRTSPLMAAFGNGILMEVLDYQDSNLEALMHSSTAVIPATLALAETNPIPWADIVPAIIAGYEIHTRLMLTIQPGHWYKGFQGTGTFGTCGAAAASGRLLRLDARQMTAALGIAGFIMPASNGDNMFKGHSVKPVHGGQAAMCGLSAAYLAQAGYRSGPLEGEPPRHHAVLHTLSNGPDLARAVDRLHERWHARDVLYKPYPIGGLITGPVELVLDILSERPIRPDEVAAVAVTTYKDAAVVTGTKYTTTESNFIDAHLSTPFCIAAALCDGEMTPRQLRKARLRDPQLHALAARVTVTEDPAMTASYPSDWPAQVTIRLHGGDTIERRIDKVKWSPQRPPSWDELAAKFHQMVDPIIGHDRTARAIDILADLKEHGTLAPLLEALRQDA